ncbi:glycosyltransferase [Microbacteriaceae bacterium VKM Ac-2854]|nr:glycosyltransferase [Microbacteriaceae bacterium VKM Ac-2854]
MSAPLDIVVIGPSRHPIRQPHAGGLESAVWNLVRMLRSRGHRVRLIAVAGSDFLDDGPSEFVLPPADWAEHEAENDTDYPVGHPERAGAALNRALDLLVAEGDRIDAIANHSLHPLPLRRAVELGAPMLTTLHTPVLPELVAAHAAAERAVSATAELAQASAGHAVGHATGRRSRFVAVSEHTRAEWARAGIESSVLPNGIDDTDWPLGSASRHGLVWSGRLVPEKGAHLAIDVARRLGQPLTLVGRIGDPEYARREVLPLLGDDIRYAGVLAQPALAALVGRSAVALVTPVWQEPFGLVVPEALLCGTPVAAFAIGGIPEIAACTRGVRTAPVGDIDALAGATRELLEATDAPARAGIRADAVRHYALVNQVARLEQLYRQPDRQPDIQPDRQPDERRSAA